MTPGSSVVVVKVETPRDLLVDTAADGGWFGTVARLVDAAAGADRRAQE